MKIYKLRYMKEDERSRFDGVVFESYDRDIIMEFWKRRKSLANKWNVFDRYYITVERRG
tara:strand:- start:1682 stop:1858 length:177 start_codon:yes stop_codon:yes gene_type:complete